MTVELETVTALAAHLDREPCRCTSTDKGVDTLGCDRHDTEQETDR